MIQALRIRQRTEEREERLSALAARSRLSKGRARPEEPCPIRTCFQQDRDRIIHCKAFRRLKHKTQVFIAPLGDHYVTRLTHTLEVAQVARTIARALDLNEDLTEAIALGHDLGHTPFGHIGEATLDSLCSQGFSHNEQSLRVVDLLEKNGQGLNLTWEVRDGIVNHSKSDIDIMGEGWSKVGTVEGQVVKIADTVAYVNHDIGDAIRARLFSEHELPADVTGLLGDSPSQRIDTLVRDIIVTSWEKSVIAPSPKVLEAANSLREFLFDRVYRPSLLTQDAQRARGTVFRLFTHFLSHGDSLPAEFPAGDAHERRVVDYVAGMTDQFALSLAERIPTRQAPV